MQCIHTGCDKKGKKIGNLAGIDLVYCQKHREYGERVLNFLINSKLDYKLNKFLRETRNSWFSKKVPKLSEESEKKIYNYLEAGIDKIQEINDLDEIDDYDEYE